MDIKSEACRLAALAALGIAIYLYTIFLDGTGSALHFAPGFSSL